jgi:MFS family permease
MVLEVTNGDWAAVRLNDDFAAGGSVAALGFVAFTVGMTVGRLGGDWVQVRIGRVWLIRGAAVLSGLGSALAALVPSEAVAIIGLVVAGLGASTLFPQFYDMAARRPGAAGAGFAPMVIGQRAGAIMAPLVVGTLASTDDFDIGAAMAVVTLPAAVVLLTSTFLGRGRGEIRQLYDTSGSPAPIGATGAAIGTPL